MLIVDSSTFKGINNGCGSDCDCPSRRHARNCTGTRTPMNGSITSGWKARMTVLSLRGGRARTMDFEAGDVGYVQQTLGHYIENTGDTDLRFLEMFKTNRYQDLSLSEWLSHTPPELVMAHLNIDRAVYDANLRKDKAVIVPE